MNVYELEDDLVAIGTDGQERPYPMVMIAPLMLSEDAEANKAASERWQKATRGRVRVRPHMRDGHLVSGYEQTRDLAGELIRGARKPRGEGRKGLKRKSAGWLEYVKEEREKSVLNEVALLEERRRRMADLTPENGRWLDTVWFTRGDSGGRYQTMSGDPGPAFDEQHERILEAGARIDAALQEAIKDQNDSYREALAEDKGLKKEIKALQKRADEVQRERAIQILQDEYDWMEITPEQFKSRLKSYERERAKSHERQDPVILNANGDVHRAWVKASLHPDVMELDDHRYALTDSLSIMLGAIKVARSELVKARRREAYALLRRIRDFDGEYDAGVMNETRDLLASAAQYLPTDWITASNESEQWLDVEWTETRGHYNHDYTSTLEPYVKQSRLRVSPSKNEIAGMLPGEPTMIHELVHRAERTVPGIRGAEWTFYTSRVSPYRNAKWEDLVPLIELTGIYSYREDEKAREDDFIEPYSGKTYGDEMDSAYEILTIGIEDLVAGNHAVVEDDDEYRQFVLGSLALL